MFAIVYLTNRFHEKSMNKKNFVDNDANKSNGYNHF